MLCLNILRTHDIDINWLHKRIEQAFLLGLTSFDMCSIIEHSSNDQALLNNVNSSNKNIQIRI